MMKFLQIKKQYSSQYGFTYYEYKHIKTGCKVCFIINKSTQYTFNVTFKTFPNDNTGVAHIVEHCIFDGSKKYPLNQLSAAISKYSFVDEQNGATCPLRTYYYAKSNVKKDFDNVFDIFLDSLFNPLFISNKNIFLKEGWRADLDKNNNKIINGVVYNEMKEGEAANTSRFYDSIFKSLHPNSIYSKSAGGKVNDIIKLKYTDAIKFYKKHYHPSNCMIILSGNIDIDPTLEYLDKDYLSKYKKSKSITYPKVKPHIGDEVITYYPAKNSEYNKTYHGLIFKMHFKNKVERIIWGAICTAYMDKSFKLFNNNLREKYGVELGSYGFDRANNNFLLVWLNTTDNKLVKSFYKDYINNLKQVIKKGINCNEIIDYLNHHIKFEEYTRINESCDYSTFVDLLSESFQTGDEFFYLLDDTKSRQKAIEYIKKNGIDKMLKERIINAPYSSFTSYPSEKEIAIRDKKREKILSNLLDKMSIESIKKDKESFEAYNNQDQRTLELKLIPTLKYSDIPDYKIDDVPSKEYKYGKIDITEHNIDFNDMCIINMNFNYDGLSIEEMQYLDLFVGLMFEFDTPKYKSQELITKINKYTIGGSNRMRIIQHFNDKNCNCYNEIYFRCEYKDLNKIFAIYNEAFFKNKFEKNLIINHLKSQINYLKNGIKNNPISLMLKEILVNASRGDYIDYEVNGHGYLKFAEKLIKDFSVEEFTRKMNSVVNKCFNENKTWISIIGNDKAVKSLLDSIKYLKLDKTIYKDNNKINFKKDISKAYIIDSQASYNFVYAPFDERNKATAIMRIADRLINTYLYREIRENGGAYGGQCTSNIYSLNRFIAYTYRDSQVKRSYKIIDKIGDYLSNLEITKNEFERIKLSALNDFSLKMCKEEKCDYYDRGKKINMTMKERKESNDNNKKIIKDCCIEDIRNLGKVFNKILKNATRITVGSKNKIEEAKEYFDEIKTI